MNILRELTTLLNYKNDPTQLQDAQRQLNSFTNQISSVGKKLSIGLSLPLTAFAGTAVVAAAKMEDARTTFDVLTGSIEEGGKFMKELTDFAAVNPLFDVGSISESAKMMMSFGIPAGEIVDTMKMMSDVLAGSGVPLERVAYNLGQIRTQERATAVDLRQFAMAGIPVYEYLAKVMKINTKQVMEYASAGKIGYAEVKAAFELMSNAGGRYFGMTEKRSKTTSGLFQQLKDKLFIFRAELGKLIIDDLRLKEVMTAVLTLAEKTITVFKGLDPSVRRLILGVAVLAAAIGPLAVGFGMLLKTMTFFAPLLATAITGPLLAALAVLFLLIDDIMAWQQGKKSLFGSLFGSFEDQIQLWKSSLESMKGFFSSIFKVEFDKTLEYMRIFFEDFGLAFEQFLADLGPLSPFRWVANIRGGTGLEKINRKNASDLERVQKQSLNDQIRFIRERQFKEGLSNLSEGQTGWVVQQLQAAQAVGSGKDANTAILAMFREAKKRGDYSNIPSLNVTVNVPNTNASPSEVGAATGKAVRDALDESMMKQYRRTMNAFAGAQ